MDAVIPSELPRHDRVLTGAAPESWEPCERTRGYRIEDDGALYVAWTDESVVRAIWLVGGPDDARRGLLVEALVGIGVLADLLLVDWRGALVDLTNDRAVERYVATL